MPRRPRPDPTEPLFDAAVAPDAPLASRMRPRTLDEFVGQPHLVGPPGALTRVVKPGHLPSMVLWDRQAAAGRHSPACWRIGPVDRGASYRPCAAATLDRLKGERMRIRAELEAAKSELRGAEHRDVQNAADAMRSGDNAPTRLAPKVTEKIEALQRSEIVARTAIADAESDLAGVVNQHRAEYLAALSDRTAAQRRKLSGTVEKYATERLALGV